MGGSTAPSAAESNVAFEVKDLVQERTEVVHLRSLLLYRAGLDENWVHPDVLRIAEHIEAFYQDVGALHHTPEWDGTIESEVQ